MCTPTQVGVRTVATVGRGAVWAGPAEGCDFPDACQSFEGSASANLCTLLMKSGYLLKASLIKSANWSLEKGSRSFSISSSSNSSSSSSFCPSPRLSPFACCSRDFPHFLVH
ncbi:unnamed protein product [Fraxinus pennsylvanica]|uniref:Uncharacterized protein n=1 Tax=Fraxinus pennsylvanica TaxID=56036 RepID=A0AAD2A3N7_9LAMI|nr:unnamed protein product [Fraxinus pennsylvanica]